MQCGSEGCQHTVFPTDTHPATDNREINFKEKYFISTSFSLKYNKTLKALLLHNYIKIYTAIGENFMINVR